MSERYETEALHSYSIKIFNYIIHIKLFSKGAYLIHPLNACLERIPPILWSITHYMIDKFIFEPNKYVFG